MSILSQAVRICSTMWQTSIWLLEYRMSFIAVEIWSTQNRNFYLSRILTGISIWQLRATRARAFSLETSKNFFVPLLKMAYQSDSSRTRLKYLDDKEGEAQIAYTLFANRKFRSSTKAMWIRMRSIKSSSFGGSWFAEIFICDFKSVFFSDIISEVTYSES